MIRLHPIPDANHTCPHCQVRLEVKGWYIPGMRCLADLKCPRCGHDFYGDLPAGHGLYYPMLLERDTGIVHDRYGVNWFADWLRSSYGNRVNSPVELSVEEFRPPKKPVLLNCLDVLYGHCLLKLLNTQYYLDHYPDLDLVVLVPRFLRWMMPDGVSAVWTVDLPLGRGIEWNDWLASQIRSRIRPLGECWLSMALSHPHPEDFDIERFTRVHPFAVDEWAEALETPTVTYIWREDRVWRRASQNGHLRRLAQKLKGGMDLVPHPLHEQRKQVAALAQALRQTFPKIDFAVAGPHPSGGLPGWIADLRTLEISEQVERAWCERYARSHVVIGVHGSNMLLPSAHAGAVVELVPADRWGNLIQDILVGARDVREAMYRYRFLSVDSSATIVAEIAASLLRCSPNALLNFNRPWSDHEALRSNPWLIEERRREMRERLADL